MTKGNVVMQLEVMGGIVAALHLINFLDPVLCTSA